MLLLALFATFFFEGIAQPGDLQRVIGTILIGAAVAHALYAAEVPARRMRIASVIILVIVVGVVIASVAGKGQTVIGMAAIANELVPRRFPPRSESERGRSAPHRRSGHSCQPWAWSSLVVEFP